MDPRLLKKGQANFIPRRSQRPGFRKRFRDNIQGITKPAIRRLARRGGVVRIKADVYNEIRVAVKIRLTEIMRHIVLFLESVQTERFERKIITTRDVVFALNRMGSTLYGF
ncbi:histone H4.2 [Aspergillus taichungensis]|uniref:Histone H4.2 n=1 Tax=Aspergillus taichungensis TaxID=482145 RepID=A0A2J5HPH3_9EURO|nr:histone H4.2 [Aspergillus taichungensis]